MSQERFHALVAATAQIIWVVSNEGSIRSDNSSWFTYTGLSQEDSGGGAWLKAVHPEDRERTVAAWQQAQAARSHYSVEYRIRRHDGVYRMFAVQGAPIFNEDGTIREWVGACTDITERKETEHALRISEQRLRLLTTHLPVGVFQTDTDGDPTYVNTRLRELCDMGPDDAIGPAWVAAIHPDDRALVAAAWQDLAQNPRELCTEYRLQRRDGSVRWVASNMTPMRDDAGKVLGYFGSLTDITARILAEARARESHERLIQAQRAALDELSTPLIPIHDEIMVMPLIGAVDRQRADRVLHALLSGIGAHRTRIAILDITGVPTVDEQVADALVGSARAVSLLGAQMVLSGIRPEVAQTLTSIGADLRGIVTCGNLQAAIGYAMSAARRRA